jgi:heme exporter protein D
MIDLYIFIFCWVMIGLAVYTDYAEHLVNHDRVDASYSVEFISMLAMVIGWPLKAFATVFLVLMAVSQKKRILRGVEKRQKKY